MAATPLRPVNTAIVVRNILIPLDFSALSETAISYGLALARNFGSTLHLAHVVHGPNTSKVSAEAHLNRLLDTMYFGNVKHESIVLEGNVPEEIDHAIKTRNVDLIVIAAQGHEGLQKIVLGSTSEGIFRKVECPVLVLGPEVPRQAPWEIKSITNIVMPYDFSHESEFALPRVFRLVEFYKARLTLVSVLPETMPFEVNLPARIEEEKVRLRGLLRDLPATWCQHDVQVRVGNTGHEVANVIRASRAELAVMGVHSGSWVACHTPNAACEIIAEAPCGVLTIHAPDK